MSWQLRIFKKSRTFHLDLAKDSTNPIFQFTIQLHFTNIMWLDWVSNTCYNKDERKGIFFHLQVWHYYLDIGWTPIKVHHDQSKKQYNDGGK